MKCRFSTGDVALINDTAEVAFEYIGQTATVVDTMLMGVGQSTPLEYDNKCFVTIQFDDGKTLDMVPDSELSPI